MLIEAGSFSLDASQSHHLGESLDGVGNEWCELLRGAADRIEPSR
jgi:hypothetical protein